MGKKNIGGAVLDDLKALPKKILKPYYKNGKLNANKVAIDGIPFVIIFYVINKYVQAVVSADGGDMLDKCVKAFSLIFQVKPYFAPSFKLTPLICGIGAGVAFKLFMNSRKKNAKQFRPREEYGSAKWGTDKDFETSDTTVLSLAKHLVPLLLFNRLYFFSKVTYLLRSTKGNNDLLLYFLHVWG